MHTGTIKPTLPNSKCGDIPEAQLTLAFVSLSIARDEVHCPGVSGLRACKDLRRAGALGSKSESHESQMADCLDGRTTLGVAERGQEKRNSGVAGLPEALAALPWLKG